MGKYQFSKNNRFERFHTNLTSSRLSSVPKLLNISTTFDNVSLYSKTSCQFLEILSSIVVFFVIIFLIKVIKEIDIYS